MGRSLGGGQRQFERAEDRLISRERGLTPEQLIESQRDAAVAVVSGVQLVAALKGEGFISRVSEIENPMQQIILARSVLKRTPFVARHVPGHLTTPEEQAGFLVACGLKISEMHAQLH